MEKIGIIAGNRKFPLIFSQSAKQKGYTVIACAVKGDTSPKLKKFVDKIFWLNLSEFSSLFKIFRSEGINKVVMAGQISPTRLFSKDLLADPMLKKIFNDLKDSRADTVFGAIAEKLKEEGFELLPSTLFIDEYLPKKGVLTKKEPDFLLWEDIYFGFDMAKSIGLLDIGQTVAVRNKSIVCVEALEGTDNLIRRAGKISRGGFTIVKVSKPEQDIRFDIPVVGLNTIKNIIRAKGKCLAFEANQTLFIDKEESIKFANKKGLIVVAV